MITLSYFSMITLLLTALGLGIISTVLVLKGKEMPRISVVLFTIAATSWAFTLLFEFLK